MKKINKVLKGFTLVELVVVIAVFGLLITATLSLITPTSRVFKNASEYSASAAMVDNVKRTIEDNLRFSNRMWVDLGPDISGGEAAYMLNTVNNLRREFLIGTSSSDAEARTTFARDIVYVMKIDNPDDLTAQYSSSGSEIPGKISIWEYDNGTLNAANSKEWAISQAVYGDYSFSLSYGLDGVVTDQVMVGGRVKERITAGTYNSFGRFMDPSNFALQLDIYENDYSNRADKTSPYNLCRTTVSNTVALSFVNMTNGTAVLNENFDYIDNNETDPSLANKTRSVRRYNCFPASTSSPDIYIFYTVPDLT